MADKSLDFLKYGSFPALGTAMRARRVQIIQRWRRAVEETLPRADQLTFKQLLDGLPDTLDQMAVVLESKEVAPIAELVELASEHGQQRFEHNYKIGEFMVEYTILRPIIIEEVGDHLGRTLTAEEVVALNLGVDAAQRRGVISYFNHHKRELQQVTEAQSKYLSFLSHDLRGSLNGVLLMMEVLRRELADEQKFSQSLDDLEMMRRAILDTVATMDRFLHAERFRHGKVKVKPTSIDVDALVNDLLSQFSYQIGGKKLELRSEIPSGYKVVSDRELLTLILQNVIGNAVKYSKQGTVTVTATQGAQRTRISVTDQGPGIAPEKLAGLFDAFTRGDTHGEPGTGLGLSIAWQAATTLGARLWAESKVGEGSTFHLDLPVKPPAPQT